MYNNTDNRYPFDEAKEVLSKENVQCICTGYRLLPGLNFFYPRLKFIKIVNIKITRPQFKTRQVHKQ